MKNNKAERYPYLQVITMFAGLGSIISGLLSQVVILLIFRGTHLMQIGYQPLLIVALVGFIPALLTGGALAYKQLTYSQKHSLSLTFLTGFIVSAAYTAIGLIFFGLSFSFDEISMSLAATLISGLFGAVCAVITGYFVLPKACTTRFDNSVKKDDDIYQDFTTLDNQSIE